MLLNDRAPQARARALLLVALLVQCATASREPSYGPRPSRPGSRSRPWLLRTTPADGAPSALALVQELEAEEAGHLRELPPEGIEGPREEGNERTPDTSANLNRAADDGNMDDATQVGKVTDVREDGLLKLGTAMTSGSLTDAHRHMPTSLEEEEGVPDVANTSQVLRNNTYKDKNANRDDLQRLREALQDGDLEEARAIAERLHTKMSGGSGKAAGAAAASPALGSATAGKPKPSGSAAAHPTTAAGRAVGAAGAAGAARGAGSEEAARAATAVAAHGSAAPGAHAASGTSAGSREALPPGFAGSAGAAAAAGGAEQGDSADAAEGVAGEAARAATAAAAHGSAAPSTRAASGTSAGSREALPPGFAGSAGAAAASGGAEQGDGADAAEDTASEAMLNLAFERLYEAIVNGDLAGARAKADVFRDHFQAYADQASSDHVTKLFQALQEGDLATARGVAEKLREIVKLEVVKHELEELRAAIADGDLNRAYELIHNVGGELQNVSQVAVQSLSSIQEALNAGDLEKARVLVDELEASLRPKDDLDKLEKAIQDRDSVKALDIAGRLKANAERNATQAGTKDIFSLYSALTHGNFEDALRLLYKVREDMRDEAAKKYMEELEKAIESGDIDAARDLASKVEQGAQTGIDQDARTDLTMLNRALEQGDLDRSRELAAKVKEDVLHESGQASNRSLGALRRAIEDGELERARAIVDDAIEGLKLAADQDAVALQSALREGDLGTAHRLVGKLEEDLREASKRDLEELYQAIVDGDLEKARRLVEKVLQYIKCGADKDAREGLASLRQALAHGKFHQASGLADELRRGAENASRQAEKEYIEELGTAVRRLDQRKALSLIDMIIAHGEANATGLLLLRDAVDQRNWGRAHDLISVVRDDMLSKVTNEDIAALYELIELGDLNKARNLAAALKGYIDKYAIKLHSVLLAIFDALQRGDLHAALQLTGKNGQSGSHKATREDLGKLQPGVRDSKVTTTRDYAGKVEEDKGETTSKATKEDLDKLQEAVEDGDMNSARALAEKLRKDMGENASEATKWSVASLPDAINRGDKDSAAKLVDGVKKDQERKAAKEDLDRLQQAVKDGDMKTAHALASNLREDTGVYGSKEATKQSISALRDAIDKGDKDAAAKIVDSVKKDIERKAAKEDLDKLQDAVKNGDMRTARVLADHVREELGENASEATKQSVSALRNAIDKGDADAAAELVDSVQKDTARKAAKEDLDKLEVAVKNGDMSAARALADTVREETGNSPSEATKQSVSALLDAIDRGDKDAAAKLVDSVKKDTERKAAEEELDKLQVAVKNGDMSAARALADSIMDQMGENASEASNQSVSKLRDAINSGDDAAAAKLVDSIKKKRQREVVKEDLDKLQKAVQGGDMRTAKVLAEHVQENLGPDASEDTKLSVSSLRDAIEKSNQDEASTLVDGVKKAAERKAVKEDLEELQAAISKGDMNTARALASQVDEEMGENTSEATKREVSSLRDAIETGDQQKAAELTDSVKKEVEQKAQPSETEEPAVAEPAAEEPEARSPASPAASSQGAAEASEKHTSEDSENLPATNGHKEDVGVNVGSSVPTAGSVEGEDARRQTSEEKRLAEVQRLVDAAEGGKNLNEFHKAIQDGDIDKASGILGTLKQTREQQHSKEAGAGGVAALREALQERELRKARELLEKVREDRQRKSPTKSTVGSVDELFEAVERGDMDRARAVATKIVGKADNATVTVLMNAIENGNLEEAQQIVEKLQQDAQRPVDGLFDAVQQGDMRSARLASAKIISEDGNDNLTTMINTVKDGHLDGGREGAKDMQEARQPPVAELFDSVQRGDMGKARVTAAEIAGKDSRPLVNKLFESIELGHQSKARDAAAEIAGNKSTATEEHVDRLFKAIQRGDMGAAGGASNAIVEKAGGFNFTTLYNAIENGELDKARRVIDKLDQASAAEVATVSNDSTGVAQGALTQASSALGRAGARLPKDALEAALAVEMFDSHNATKAGAPVQAYLGAKGDVQWPSAKAASGGSTAAILNVSDKVFARLGEAMERKDLERASQLAREAREEMQQRAQQVMGNLSGIQPEIQRAELDASEGLKECTLRRGAPEDMLEQLRTCTANLHKFAEVTESMRLLSMNSNNEYQQSLDQVSSLLTRLRDAPTMAAALARDQQKARQYLLDEADKLFASIDSIRQHDAEQ